MKGESPQAGLRRKQPHEHGPVAHPDCASFRQFNTDSCFLVLTFCFCVERVKFTSLFRQCGFSVHCIPLGTCQLMEKAGCSDPSSNYQAVRGPAKKRAACLESKQTYTCQTYWMCEAARARAHKNWPSGKPRKRENSRLLPRIPIKGYSLFFLWAVLSSRTNFDSKNS